MMNTQFPNRTPYFIRVLQQSPSATAEISGSPSYPAIRGRVHFYQTKFGVLVLVQVSGLPKATAACDTRTFACHIHAGSSCTGNQDDPFADAMTHDNPENCEHPHHAGDLPPLWGNDGYAFALFLTDRFSVEDVIGKTVIIHANPDDFTTQPAGNAGQKIACGVIERPLLRDTIP